MSTIIRKLLGIKLSGVWLSAIVLVEIVLSTLIVYKVSYTEIDWRAYMQEVEGFLAGERDYTKMQGDTGPLVYPAGFLYIFSGMRYLTTEGTDIFTAQCIFVGLYVITLATTLWLYILDGGFTVSACALLVMSKRIRSIFMLRMFNDTIAVLFGLWALVAFCTHRFRCGCFLYSVGVSVKMNMLLYAPGVLIVLLMSNSYIDTFWCLSLCAAVQLVLGFPFLSTYPVEYLKKAFELDRVFTYKWTVNFKFLPEDLFVSKKLSILLLFLTVVAYLLFGYRHYRAAQRVVPSSSATATNSKRTLTPNFIITTIFMSNFIGIVFSRTIHYQFYCWYFHSLTYLLWQTELPIWVRVCVALCIEVCYNVYPATAASSFALQVCHITLLAALFVAPWTRGERPIYAVEKNRPVDSKEE